MTRSLHYNVKGVRVISPGSLGATNAGGVEGQVVDRNGFDALEFFAEIGAVTATNATVTAKVFAGDATGALATAGASDLIGSLDIVTATSVRVAGVSEHLVRRVGYIGPHEFVRMDLVPTVSGEISAGVIAVLGAPHYAPVASDA